MSRCKIPVGLDGLPNVTHDSCFIALAAWIFHTITPANFERLQNSSQMWILRRVDLQKRDPGDFSTQVSCYAVKAEPRCQGICNQLFPLLPPFSGTPCWAVEQLQGIWQEPLQVNVQLFQIVSDGVFDIGILTPPQPWNQHRLVVWKCCSGPENV